jgi:type II secretory pathway pseudopilin PulG
MTLIECVVAIALLVIVLVPTTLFVIEGERSASQAHLETEATSLADQALGGLQAEASRGNLPAGFQSETQSVDEVGSRKTVYTISTTWTPIVQGTNKTICAAGPGVSVTQQIWLVTASVTWNGMDGVAPISDTTEIAPGTDGGLQQSSGEVAVTLDSVGTSIFKAASVTATMSAVWTGVGGAPSVPSGEFISESETTINVNNGKFDGCLIFENLDADPGWLYTLSFAGNGAITQSQEYSDENPNGAYTVGSMTLQVGVPQILTVDLGVGTQINVAYTQGTPTGASCTTAPTGALTAPATTSEIPITVNNSGLTSYPPNDDWVAYKAGALPIPDVLLYPYYSSVTSIWAGDGQNSAQLVPCQVNPSAGVAQTVYLQLYDLSLGVSGPGASAMTATDLGSVGAGLALAGVSGGKSATDLPLGEYALSDPSGAVETSGAVQAIVWVTTGGSCLTATATPTPPTSCNSPITGLTAP